MAILQADIFMDFFSSLAVLVILAWIYGALSHRRMIGQIAPVAVGLMFGMVAVLQMHAPISPVDGLIIDMRAVPVGLAGAFLGRRGLIACLAVACAGRYEIGGVGTLAGTVGIMISGFAGLIWDRATKRTPRRDLRHLLVLSAAVSTGLFSGLLLPPTMAAWFFGVAALPLMAVNAAAVLIIGSLMERERRLQRPELRHGVMSDVDARSGLLSEMAFLREVANRSAAATCADPVKAIMVVEIRHYKWLMAHWGSKAVEFILGGLRHRLRPLCTYNDILGVTERGDILIPLTSFERENRASLSTGIRRAVADRAVSLPNGETVRVSVADYIADIPATATVELIASALRMAEPCSTQTAPAKPGQLKSANLTDSLPHPALFEKAAMLLERQQS